MNKLGNTGNKLMVFTFFLLLLIIAVGIVAGVLVFYGDEYSFKKEDSYVLNYLVYNCLNENKVSEVKGRFYDICNINREVILDSYSIKICYGSDDCITDNTEKVIFSEGSNFQVCGIKGLEENDFAGKCHKEYFFVDGVKIDILTIANQNRRYS